MRSQISRLSKLSILLLLGMVLLCLANAFLHDPSVGYDADDYAAYIDSLSRGKLPVMGDNDEFFTPPLPFIIPALIKAVFDIPIDFILKIAQLLNIFVALGSAWVLLRISDQLTNRSHIAQNMTLTFALSLPVFYKTHALVRAEPYLVFFILLYIDKLLQLSKKDGNVFFICIHSGLIFGAVLLSRQWGILILPAVGLYALLLVIKNQEHRAELIKGFVLSGLIAFVVSGWFYLSLLNRYGSVTAFNRDPVEQLSLKNKPASFYIGYGNGKLFSDPVRDRFDNQLLPILYSETWGDYWGYFVVYGRDTRTASPVQGGLLQLALEKEGSEAWIETNRFDIAPYLGRVNLISMIPTVIASISFLWGCGILVRGMLFRGRIHFNAPQLSLITGVIISTIIGYVWFLIQYPSTDGDTIKATYILQIFPFLALLIGYMGDKISQKYPGTIPMIMITILLTWVHNLPAMLSNY